MFDGSTSPPSFSRGCLPGDPAVFRRGLRLSEFTLTGPTRFICELRQVYKLFCLEFQKRSERRAKRDQKLRESPAKLDEALKHAKDAFFGPQKPIVEDAMKPLKQGYDILATLLVVIEMHCILASN